MYNSPSIRSLCIGPWWLLSACSCLIRLHPQAPIHPDWTQAITSTGVGACGVGGSCWPDPRLNCQPLSLRESPPASLCTSTSATTLVSGALSCFIYLLSSFCHPAFKPNPLSSEPSDLPVVVVRLFLSYSVVVCGADQSPRQVRACLHASWMALSSMVSACWHPRRTGGRLTVWVVWKGGVSTWRRPFWCCVTRVAREPHWTGLNRVHLENKVMHSIA